MPLRKLKEETADSLTLQWVLHVQNYKLTLDKNRCVGCQICTLACPKEAITLQKQPRTSGQKARKAKADVDLSKCNFCGICDIACPYGAIKVSLNGKHALPVLEKESFPEFIRDIRVDESKVNAECLNVSDPCPLGLITIKSDAASAAVKVEVDKEHCPCCTLCEVKLPGVMHVRKMFSGRINIRTEKCPENCTDCLDVCPITGALCISETDKKVRSNEAFCVYCGACKVVCPIDEALELKRTHISHMPIHSGAWNKTLERLTSPVEMTKELKTKGSTRARESVKKRVGLKVD
jgi:4Fe-4S ferredoxin